MHTPPAGLEPAACALGKRCSIQLSYEGRSEEYTLGCTNYSSHATLRPLVLKLL